MISKIGFDVCIYILYFINFTSTKIKKKIVSLCMNQSGSRQEKEIAPVIWTENNLL